MSQRVKFGSEQVIYPYSLRGGMNSISTLMSDGVIDDKSRLNRETLFIEADSNYYKDILMVTGVNSSDQAIRVNLHENFGGSAQFKVQMAANSSTQIFFQVPWNASEKGMAWYTDYEVFGGVTNADDVTNTVVALIAQYINRT